MTPAWFIVGLLVMNVGAALVFAWQREWPWCAVYAGASLIQAGCWVMVR